MKKKAFPSGSREAVWMPCSLHGAKGFKLPWMPSLGLSARKYILWGNKDSVGGRKHDAVHRWLMVSSLGLNPSNWGVRARLCLMDDGENPRRQLSSNAHTTLSVHYYGAHYLTSQVWWDRCKRPWLLICHEPAKKLKARLVPPCASVYSSVEGLARPSLWLLRRFSSFHPTGLLTPQYQGEPSPFREPPRCWDEGKAHYRVSLTNRSVAKRRLRILG